MEEKMEEEKKDLEIEIERLEKKVTKLRENKEDENGRENGRRK